MSAYAYTEALAFRLWQALACCIQVQLREESNESDKYFRLKLKINILNPLCWVIKILVDHEEDQIYGVLLYERLPKLCFNCGRINHLREDCSLGSPQYHLPDYLSYGLRMEAKNPIARLKWSSLIKGSPVSSSNNLLVVKQPLPSLRVGRVHFSIQDTPVPTSEINSTSSSSPPPTW